MARVKLDLPEALPFSTGVEVRIGDINYGRHLGNDALLGLLHEARLRFLARHRFTETDVGGPITHAGFYWAAGFNAASLFRSILRAAP